MKSRLVLLIVLFSISLASQNDLSYEKPPVFDECASESIKELKNCFSYTLNNYIFKNFQVPDVVTKESYQGNIQVLFEVDKEGQFSIIYIDAVYEELKEEAKRVFALLPKITPATYNAKPTFVQYSTNVKIPLEAPVQTKTEAPNLSTRSNSDDLVLDSSEIDSVNASIRPYEKLEYKSQLNIPFTHTYYARFDGGMNAVGTNSHTAAKPFVYDEVASYYDFDAEKAALSRGETTWLGRKFWDEHFVEIQSEDYWFVFDPIVDLQVGKDTEADFNSTFNNTRGIIIQGGLGKKFNFSASVYESQGRFAQYFNQFAESIRASGPDPAIVPGRGIAKRFKDDAYDYPVAEGYISYAPSKFFNVQFGHGKNFIGDGYRSLIQSDVTSPYPFLKTNIKFWKIKYTSTWMSLRDVREEVLVDKTFRTKYMANHYLSWNISKRLNICLFESVMWQNSNDRGFDINYLNPVIFFRAIEFQTGQGNGNAILGLTGKYKWNNKVNIYSQFLVDEFSLSDIKGGEKSWKNKLGFQLGAKYYNAFNIDNLLLQAEYNQVRPYTYAHNTIVLNYAHNNQPMAHLWGANFREFILIGRYNYQRWFADAKLIFGQRGFDFNTEEDSLNYGGDIYGDEDFRVGDTGIEIGQGNKTTVFHGELQAGYILNPISNLKLFTNISYRNFDPTLETATTVRSNTVWFNIGLRTDLFNWYNDF